MTPILGKASMELLKIPSVSCESCRPPPLVAIYDQGFINATKNSGQSVAYRLSKYLYQVHIATKPLQVDIDDATIVSDTVAYCNISSILVNLVEYPQTAQGFTRSSSQRSDSHSKSFLANPSALAQNLTFLLPDLLSTFQIS
jgi:hypothetical protein